MFCPVHPQGDFKVHSRRVSFGRVSYKQRSTFKRKKKLPDLACTVSVRAQSRCS